MKQNRFILQKSFRFKRFMRRKYAAFCSLRKVVSIGVVAGCVLTSMHVSTTKAQTFSNAEQRPQQLEQELEEVMVTASRLEMPVSQTAKIVTVITKEQISQAPIQSIQDLLVYVANIDVIQRGGHGVQADISIRGGSFDQNAILLNGVNLSNPQTGHYSFDIPINLSDIERIEIIHGPSALVYGASAFSGGINIITKKNIDNRFFSSMEAGMHKLRGIEIRGAEKIGQTVNSLSVGYKASDGYIENSDYDIYNVLWQTCLRFNNQSKINLQLGYNNKKYGANTFYSAKYPNQYERTSSYVGSIKGEFGSKLKFIPIIYWNRHHDQFDLVKDTDYGRNYHRNDTYGANLIFMYRSKLGNTSLGGEVRKEDIMSTVLGKPMKEPHRKYLKYDDRTNTSISLEHSLLVKRFVISAGALMNHNNLLKGKYEIYPAFSVSYRPIDELKVSSSWSKSTRMPTFTDLYYTTETHNGNEGLKPEKSEAFDLSIKYSSQLVQSYITGFLLWGTDMIDWVKETPEDTKWSSWNLSKLKTRGIEMGIRLSLAEMSPVFGKQCYLSLDYTRMYLKYDSKDLVSIYALNYLRDKFTAKFHHQIYKGFSAGWYFRYQKRMGTYEKYENLEKVNDEPYPTFSTLDLKLNYQYKEIGFNVNFNNLYNTNYFDLGNILQPGFWFTGGITYKFN